ncbi:S8 family peptidase [Evansella tamaricis]|uniref:S8 family peptidase n=1 Tax=Evansella tamaricis TaxID=2069301 RepID=A0ABS6JCB7_9BACI|nr:S8 family peptidase [Evansella tamaricis]MBU9711310.1 S8 family peptidase [Evansella tamaricis]
MNSLRRLTILFSIVLLTVLGIWFASDHLNTENQLGQPNFQEAQQGQDVTFRASMDELMAEDLSFTIEMFLHQVEEDLLSWIHAGESEDESDKMLQEVNDHPHIHGFVHIDGNKETLKLGEVSQNPKKKLAHQKDNGTTLSDPFIHHGTKRLLIGVEGDDGKMVVGEIDLSFIEKFIKDVATLSDANGQFFIGDSQDISLSEEETELPYAKKEVPEIGWDLYVKSDDTPTDEQHYKESEVIVELVPDVDRSTWAMENNLKIIDKFNDHLIVRDINRTTEEMVRDLQADASVTDIEPNYTFSKQYVHKRTTDDGGARRVSPYRRNPTPNDEFYDPYQWNFSQIHAEQGWQITTGQDQIPIAIVDSGIDPDHFDLAEKILDGYNAFEDNRAYEDDHGHGTHVAGVAGAITNNLDGVAGISWNNPLLAVKVLDHNAEGNSFTIAKGIAWAVDHGAKVINLSLGDSHHSDIMYEAIRYAYENDVVLIAASGNDNIDTPMYPAAYEEVLAVAAVDPHRERAFFSNYGNHIDVSAPGEHIASTFPGNQYVMMSGTSMASPHVAGMAGLIRSVDPSITNDEVYHLIRTTSDDLGPKGYDPYYGYGNINIKKALEDMIR